VLRWMRGGRSEEAQLDCGRKGVAGCVDIILKRKKKCS
jgi:hypothetical protein